MDVGAVTMVMWTFREREKINSIFDRIAERIYYKLYTHRCVASDIDDKQLQKLHILNRVGTGNG